MNAIVGFSDLLLKTDLPQKERQDYTAIINTSGVNLVSIIDDLIEMSKIDTNQVSPNDDAVDIDVVLGELHKAIQISIPEHKLLDFQIRKPVNRLFGKVITDQVKLTQVLTNLITNAIKYTESGFVIFGYEVNANLTEIEFTVQDSGIGIPQEHQARIFDRFHRIENDFTIKAGGLGLGLAISKAYVKMMGGRITIDSSDSNGTTISFTIPLRYGNSIRTIGQQGVAHTAKASNGITILIAEDDNINFLLIQKMLHQGTHHIIRAKDGQEAIDICTDQENIDLVLMDIKMPVKDGYTAFEEIRSFRPNLPIIAQTAYASSEDEKKILGCGFRGYISKPIKKEKLFELIENIIASKYSALNE
jgi:CheY-like chemotaxis protein